MGNIHTHNKQRLPSNKNVIRCMTPTAYFKVTTNSASLSLFIVSTTCSADNIVSPSKTRYSMSTSSSPTIGFARLMVSACGDKQTKHPLSNFPDKNKEPRNIKWEIRTTVCSDSSWSETEVSYTASYLSTHHGKLP